MKKRERERKIKERGPCLSVVSFTRCFVLRRTPLHTHHVRVGGRIFTISLSFSTGISPSIWDREREREREKKREERERKKEKKEKWLFQRNRLIISVVATWMNSIRAN